jgi:hypothetical protein
MDQSQRSRKFHQMLLEWSTSECLEAFLEESGVTRLPAGYERMGFTERTEALLKAAQSQ